jgi:hypothetical protein
VASSPKPPHIKIARPCRSVLQRSAGLSGWGGGGARRYVKQPQIVIQRDRCVRMVAEREALLPTSRLHYLLLKCDVRETALLFTLTLNWEPDECMYFSIFLFQRS